MNKAALEGRGLYPIFLGQIQNCSTWQQLRSLWLAIEEDYKKHSKQYDDEHYPFLCKIWTKRWDTLCNEQGLADSAVDF